MNDRCVLFYGDSFVAGAGDPASLGWPGHLVAAAWDAGLPMTAYNLGVRGETTPGVAARFEAEARPRVIPDADNMAVISCGANDVSLNEEGKQDISTEESLGALGRMLDAAESLRMRVLIVGPGPAGIADHDERSRELGRQFADLGASRGARYIAVLDGLLANDAWGREARENDGIHPGAEGYRALADLVLEGGWLDWLAEA
jgi:lysophospholipase L1-like esterase